MPRGCHFAPEDLSHPGEENGMAILTEHQARLIFWLAKERTYSQMHIAELFQISQSAVRDIVTRRTWRHLDYGDGSKG
jgi:predicted XRE-type DNA-binding protein